MLMPSIFGNDFMNDFFGGFPYKSNGTMQTDVSETDKGYKVTMNLPGYQKEDIKGEVKDGYLTVTATTRKNNDEKDKDGKYIMQPDPTDATKTLLFGKYPVKVVSNKTLKSTNVLKGGSGSDKNDVTGYKYPVYMGDLKEAVTLFDREKMTIELSTEAGDLWAKDLTGIKVRDRFDVQSVDETAVVKGEISVAVAG